MAKLGLVTVLYKSNDVLEDFFKSLSLQSFKDYHLYLIDNSHSVESDQLIEHLIKKYPITGYTHIRNSGNFGVAKGNNQGIELSLKNNSKYVLLLNNDIDFSQTFLLEDMIKCADQGKEDIIVPKIFYHSTRKIWMAGGKLLKYRGYTTHVGEDQDDLPRYNNAAYFNYAPTCFMLISQNVFNDIGFMDEKYFVYYDDTDFITRAVNRGYKIYFMPSIEIFHKVANSTGGGESLFSIYYQNRNRIYFIRKNFSAPIRQIAFIYTILTRVIRYAMYNKARKRELFKAVVDGLKLN